MRFYLFFSKNQTEKHFPNIGQTDSYIDMEVETYHDARQFSYKHFEGRWSHISEKAGQDSGVFLGSLNEIDKGAEFWNWTTYRERELLGNN